MRHSLSLSAFAIVILLATSIAADSTGLTVEFEHDAVSVHNVTPGGEIAWLSVAHVSKPYVVRLEPRTGSLVDHDSDGTVRLDLKTEIPTRSTWVLVDVATGRTAVASPEGFETRWAPEAGELSRDAEGQLNRLRVDRGTPLALVVRPGVGAWNLEAHDGGPADADERADGRTTIALDRATPATAATGELVAPSDLVADDLVVVINVDRLTVLSRRIDLERLTTEGGAR